MKSPYIFPTPRSLHLWLASLALLLSACSTTSHLPEDEQLYIGIDHISYDGTPLSSKHKAKQDSAGVITSIGNAVEAVGDVLRGNGTKALEEQMKAPEKRKLSAEERRAEKKRREAEEAAFATAKEEVEAVLAYPPNYALFGSSSMRSPFPVGLWVYNGFVDHQEGLGKWIFKTFAATPVYVSTVSPEVRARVAANTLHNYGFFSGRVNSEVLTQRNPRKAKVAYSVYAGPLHRLDSIAYLNFPARADSLLRATEGQRLLRKGDAFSVVNLSNEQTRIENLFRENGYYYYSAAYTTYRADTLMRPGFVQLRVAPLADRPERVRHQWHMGHTYISMRRADLDQLDQSVQGRTFTFNYSGKKMPLRAPMWFRAVSHRKGELFRLSDSNTTLEKLGAMGVFSQIDVNYVPQDTTENCDTLDLYISTVMDKLFDSSFEMNATLKSNQQVGPGVSYGISKRNAFRGGEKVSFKIFGSYEWQTRSGRGGGNSLLNSYELGTELSLEFPRFMMPVVHRRHFRMPSSTTFALNADWKNRAGFFQMMSFGGNITYKWHKTQSTNHEFTLFSLDYDRLIHKTGTFDSIMTANPALYVSMRNQFVPSMSYTITYASAANHRNPVWLQFSIKEAGNVTSGIYAAVGKKFNEQNKNLFGSPFAQFVKVTAEGHENIRLNSRFSLAARLFAGAIYSYGNSRRAPYADQFYVGGANSVRAFTVRTIGPGRYRSDNSKYAYIDQTGDFKLEANAEFRARLFGSLHGAIFLDAGNVWLLRKDAQRPGGELTMNNLKHIAVGTGAGLRYDLDFLVLRFDVGIGLHAPYQTSRSGFYNLERFKDGFAFHFAIGYPF